MTELCKFVTFEKAVWSSNYPSDVHYIFLNDYFSYKQCLCDKKNGLAWKCECFLTSLYKALLL